MCRRLCFGCEAMHAARSTRRVRAGRHAHHFAHWLGHSPHMHAPVPQRAAYAFAVLAVTRDVGLMCHTPKFEQTDDGARCQASSFSSIRVNTYIASIYTRPTQARQILCCSPAPHQYAHRTSVFVPGPISSLTIWQTRGRIMQAMRRQSPLLRVSIPMQQHSASTLVQAALFREDSAQVHRQAFLQHSNRRLSQQQVHPQSHLPRPPPPHHPRPTEPLPWRRTRHPHL